MISAADSHAQVLNIQTALHVLTALNLNSYKISAPACVFDGQSFDYIIIGGGTAGCVLANRLVEDNNTTVLLIEAGDRPPIESDFPALMLYGKSKYDAWQFKVQDFRPARETRKETDDDMSLGKILGGSSGFSYLWYSPGSKHDYNQWAKSLKNPTWNWPNISPYIKKSTRIENSPNKNNSLGTSGNMGLTVIPSVGDIRVEPYYNFLEEAGNKINLDANGPVNLGYSSAVFTISNNIRQSTVISYLVEKHPNLYVLQNAVAKKILFDSCKNAIGVEVFAKKCSNKHIYVKAKIEVILSAGVVNSPKLLMLSGIGRKNQLDKHKIHTIADLPVGEGLKDHIGIPIVINMTKLKLPEKPFNPKTFPATVTMGYVALNKSKHYPDYQVLTFINFPKFQMNYCVRTYDFKDSICDNFFQTAVNTQTMFNIIHLQNSISQGNVTLKSNDYRDDPLIYTGYLTAEEDFQALVSVIQDFSKIERTKTFKELGGQFKNPKLDSCGNFNLNDLNYLKCYIRHMIVSSHQYSSTCAMGHVVDSRLRVYNVKRLRVVDASVMPYPTAGGTLGSTVIIAEKAADMIKNDRKKLEKCLKKIKNGLKITNYYDSIFKRIRKPRAN